MRNSLTIDWGWGVALALALAAPAAAAGQTYDPSADFSAISNPNGPWRYGSTATLGGALTLYPNHVNQQGLDFWQFDASVATPPDVSHNGTASPILFSGSVPYPPGQLGMHPGPSGEYSVVRWTAPAGESVTLSGSFYRLDPAATTDVHLLRNGASIFDGTVNSASPVPFTLTTDVLFGDTIDFAVGFGGNGYNFDSTGLSATIQVQPVPEPSSLLVVAAVAGLAVTQLRRRVWKAPLGG
jgi:hypothetical protein